MRLGDLDALKERIQLAPNKNEETWEELYDSIIYEIDNAPTVEPQKVVTIPHELIEKLVLCVVDIVENIDWDKAIEAYKARPQGEWIAVKDKLPDTDGFYLVSLENGQIVAAHSSGIIENHDFEPKMLAWQPLPEPYKKGGAE